VARGQVAGYQLLLGPDFLLAGPDSGLLLAAVGGEVPEQGPAAVTELAGAGGPGCVVYRTLRATRQDAGAPDRPAEPLLDRAGRPLVLTYGFACRGARVTAADDRDLRVARDAALATYRRFRAGEASFRARTSHPYALRSAVTPVPAAPRREPARPASGRADPGRNDVGWRDPGGRDLGPGQSGRAGAAPVPWARQALPGRPVRGTGQGRPRLAVALILAAVLAVAGLATGGYLVTQAGRPASRAALVAVPDVTGLTEQAAATRLRRARLVPRVRSAAASLMPAGLVAATSPRAGARVPGHSVVTLQVSGWPARPAAGSAGAPAG
jgi:hypothetical protein